VPPKSADRVAVGDFSSRANLVESERRGQALVEMTVVGRAGLSLRFSDLATVSSRAGGWVGMRGTPKTPLISRLWAKPRGRRALKIVPSSGAWEVDARLVNQRGEWAWGFLPRIVAPFGAWEVPRLPTRPPARDDRLIRCGSKRERTRARERSRPFCPRCSAHLALLPRLGRGSVSHIGPFPGSSRPLRRILIPFAAQRLWRETACRCSRR
jgi:hypothetical protein